MNRFHTLLLAAALLSFAPGCESTVGAVVEYTVPADVVSEVVVASALVSEVSGPVGGTFIVMPVCETSAGELFSRRYDSRFGCRRELEDPSATARAWIVPIPSHWNSQAFCASTDYDRNDFAVPPGYDLTELPEPTAADPQAQDSQDLGGQFLGCGGSANLELVLSN